MTTFAIVLVEKLAK